MRKTLFTRRFSAAHRLWDDPGICHRIHGHNYRAEIAVAVERLHFGMVVHADEVKSVVDGQYDHRLILSKSDPIDVIATRPSLENPQPSVEAWIVRIEGNPTTEILARKIASDIAGLIERDQGHGWVEVCLSETDTIMAIERVEW